MNQTSGPPASLPALVLYGRPGCGLCDETREIIDDLLAGRAAAGLAAPPIVERDITSDPEWERAYLLTIPVVELGERRLELATSAAQIRALLERVLDRAPAPGAGR